LIDRKKALLNPDEKVNFVLKKYSDVLQEGVPPTKREFRTLKHKTPERAGIFVC
jgi:hypothetical protein